MGGRFSYLVAEAMVETAGGGAELGVGRKSTSEGFLDAGAEPWGAGMFDHFLQRNFVEVSLTAIVPEAVGEVDGGVVPGLIWAGVVDNLGVSVAFKIGVLKALGGESNNLVNTGAAPVIYDVPSHINEFDLALGEEVEDVLVEELPIVGGGLREEFGGGKLTAEFVKIEKNDTSLEVIIGVFELKDVVHVEFLVGTVLVIETGSISIMAGGE